MIWREWVNSLDLTIMKKILITLSLVAISYFGCAQTPQNNVVLNPIQIPIELAKNGTPLSPEQHTKWHEVVRKYMKVVHDLRTGNKPQESEEMRLKMETELNAILTTDQRKKLDEIRSERLGSTKVE